MIVSSRRSPVSKSVEPISPRCRCGPLVAAAPSYCRSFQTASQGAPAVLALLALTKRSSSGRGRSLIVFAYTSSTSSKWVKFVVGSSSYLLPRNLKPG
jgi:hypothetical protein